MSNEFQAYKDSDNYWKVTWKNASKIIDAFLSSNLRLMPTLFSHTKCNEVGLLLRNNTESCVIWVTCSHYESELTNTYVDWIHRYHDVYGVAFHEEAHAKSFLDLLEKKYLWYILKE